ncbi:MAG TPA: hypothetical protein VF704_00870 [Allosphingosinicella sp.]
MNDKIKAGKAVAARLFPAENAIDQALIASASFQIALLTARREAQQPCGTIQRALDEVVTSNQALLDARRAMVEAHAQVVRLRHKMGLPPTGYGCETPCQPPIELEPQTHLKAVGGAA